MWSGSSLCPHLHFISFLAHCMYLLVDTKLVAVSGICYAFFGPLSSFITYSPIHPWGSVISITQPLPSGFTLDFFVKCVLCLLLQYPFVRLPFYFILLCLLTPALVVSTCDETAFACVLCKFFEGEVCL